MLTTFRILLLSLIAIIICSISSETSSYFTIVSHAQTNAEGERPATSSFCKDNFIFNSEGERLTYNDGSLKGEPIKFGSRDSCLQAIVRY